MVRMSGICESFSAIRMTFLSSLRPSMAMRMKVASLYPLQTMSDSGSLCSARPANISGFDPTSMPQQVLKSDEDRRVEMHRLRLAKRGDDRDGGAVFLQRRDGHVAVRADVEI